jgi:hypothetical protein
VHQIARTGIAVAAIGALGAAFAAGVSYGSADRTTGAASQGSDLRLVNADLRPAASCDDLLRWYVDHGVDRVTPYGWDYMRIYTLEDSSGGVAMPQAARADEATSSETGTNVQEAGVDEPDVVKTDGSLLVRVEHENTLAVYDVTGAEPERLGFLHLDGMFAPELLLAGDRVVVIGRDPGAAKGRLAPGTTVLVVDVADPSSPTVVHEASYDSSLVTARQHGDVVRLVVSVGLPDLDFVEPGWLRREESALKRNQDVVRASTISDWLPHVATIGSDGAVRETLVDCEDVAVPAHDAGLGTVAVVGFDVDDPASVDTTAVTTPSETVYVSDDQLYLASSPYRFGWDICCWDIGRTGWEVPAIEPAIPELREDEGKTYLYGFDLTGTSATYSASGEVAGSIADRWSMDEHDGVLRVAVGPTMGTRNANSVVTFFQVGSDLVEIGRVDDLGINEQIKSVRWFDDLAVVVTFRQTDPFYAIDLSEPSDPELLGELKISGFSSYLHPVGDDLMIGIGSAADPETGQVWGAKASLFDVSDLTSPREVSHVDYRSGSQALAEYDPRQFTWLPDRRTALTVLTDGYDGYTAHVSVLRVGDGSMSSELVELGPTGAAEQVRLVPLPDGRVVLTTANEVSFLAV